MAARLRTQTCDYAHMQRHKCPAFRLRQIAAGAKGCVARKSVKRKPWSRPASITSGDQSDRLARKLNGSQRTPVLGGRVCDHAEQVEQANEAALAVQASINVLVEINVGANRCGVEPGVRRWNWHARLRLHPVYGLPVCRLTTAAHNICVHRPSVRPQLPKRVPKHVRPWTCWNATACLVTS